MQAHTSPPLPRDEAFARSLVQFGSLWVTGLGVLLAFTYWWESDGTGQLRAALYVLASCVGVAALLLGHWTSWRLAAYSLIWGMWTIIVLVALQAGGIHSNNHLGFQAMLVFAGWALGARPTFVLLAATVAVVVLFKIGFDLGWVREGRAGALWSYTVYFSGMAMLTTVSTLMARRIFENRALEAEAATAKLQASERELRKLSLAVEQCPASILITDADAHVIYANQAFYESSGYTHAEVIGLPSSRVSTSGLQGQERLSVHEALRRGQVWQGDLHNRRKDGSVAIEDVRIAPLHEGGDLPAHFVVLKQDITERVQSQATIYQLSNFDNVTGLPNRYAFLRRLSDLSHAQQRPLKPVVEPAVKKHGLLLLDVDRFTEFNDVHGALIGDQLLRAVAACLSSILPPSGLLVRNSSDEFAIVLEGIAVDLEDAQVLTQAYGERLVSTLDAAAIRVHGMPEAVRVTCSVGMCVFPDAEGDTEIEALRRAHTAMHEAKRLGGARSVMFEEALADNANRRYRIEKGLRRAIGDGQLRLYLQGQFDGSNQPVGVEALVRWEHPERGLVSPGTFIPVAEESDLIVLLGDWVLEQVCQLLAQPALQAQQLKMSVNVSARHFLQADFAAKLELLLQRTGANPHLLTLEVTEGLVLSDFEEAANKMRYLRTLGVEFALDDFGTGYSSMAYLKRLPIQEIKIDQSFVRDVDSSTHSEALVEAILWVAHRFGLRVVAEGVETLAHAELLRRWEPGILCQGYFYERPMPYREWMQRFPDVKLPPQED